MKKVRINNEYSVNFVGDAIYRNSYCDIVNYNYNYSNLIHYSVINLQFYKKYDTSLFLKLRYNLLNKADMKKKFQI